MTTYTILSRLSVSGAKYLWPEWDRFRSAPHEAGEADLTIHIQAHRPVKYGLELMGEQPGPLALRCGDALVAANAAWSRASVTLLEGREGLVGALSGLLLTHLSTRHGLLIHASLVETPRGGLLFVGPSGIGKTTQAELWQRHRGACIINGDMVLLQETAQGFIGAGSPWHGSSPYCENRQVALAAMIVLEQAKENCILPLRGAAAVEHVMRSLFLPVWYEQGVSAACDTLGRLLAQVPVYHLACRPEEAAVALLEKTIRENAASGDNAV